MGTRCSLFRSEGEQRAHSDRRCADEATTAGDTVRFPIVTGDGLRLFCAGLEGDIRIGAIACSEDTLGGLPEEVTGGMYIPSLRGNTARGGDASRELRVDAIPTRDIAPESREMEPTEAGLTGGDGGDLACAFRLARSFAEIF
jgi:hypothetical protein